MTSPGLPGSLTRSPTRCSGRQGHGLWSATRPTRAAPAAGRRRRGMGGSLRRGGRPHTPRTHVRADPPARRRRVIAAGRAAAPHLGHAEHRVLRRATRRWPAIERSAATARSTARRRGPARPAGRAARGSRHHGRMAGRLATGFGTSAVAVAKCRGSFALGDIADLNWQLTLDGDPLSEAEAEAVAAAEGVAAASRALGAGRPGHRAARPRAQVGELTRAQALSAALTGQITVDGSDVACAGAGRLAAVVAALREAAASTRSISPTGSTRPCATTSAEPSSGWRGPRTGLRGAARG